MTQATRHADSASIADGKASPPSFALGLILPRECNLACAFCYRDPSHTDRLTPAQVGHGLLRGLSARRLDD